jgi:hypothetical protein
VYLARVVEAVAPEFGAAVRCETVLLKTREGARRFRELSAALGRLAPIPSIFLDGELAFGTTPAVEELRLCLQQRRSPAAGG